MTDILAVINAGEWSTQGVLAAEALRRAAGRRGLSIAVEVRTEQGVLLPLDMTAETPSTRVLLVMADEGAPVLDVAAERFAAHPQTRATLDAVLADADAVLAGCVDASAPAPVPVPVPVPVSASVVPRIVAITSCPTGIAHTFMAAEGLQQAGKALGYAIRVETQGSVGARDTLSEAEIRDADIVLVAADRQVDLSRFAGKRVFLSGTKPAINDGQALIARALAEAQVQGGAAAAAAETTAETTLARRERTGAYKHLMTGVSFMLPFVVAGGLMIAVAFALGGIYAFDDAHKGTLAYSLFQIGAKGAFVLMVPALAGYIAFSIADRPGIAPGMIGGLVAANLGAGFLGGIAAGFIAGYGVAFLNRAIRLPRTLDGLKPVLILPTLGTLLTGLLMIYVVGGPVAQVLAALTRWLQGMQSGSAILLGLLIGAMMAIDMGGPVNKAAYAFSTGLIASQVYTPMAAAMVGGMTPPLALALAARLFADRFTVEEREAGNAAAVLGLAFVTEGAIPFAARDPLRVIPALALGSGVAGAISLGFGVELKVPHGGVFVLPIPNAVSHLGAYVLALVAGTLVSTLALRVLLRPVARR